MTKATGGPAFPVLDYITPEKVATYNNGMTLRDYFAAKAMQGILAGLTVPSMPHKEMLAIAAYEYADAMLEAR